jgi:hypothetical protein
MATRDESNRPIAPPQARRPPAPRPPSAPAPCGGRTGPAVSVQRKTASAPVAPAVPAPCGGRTGPAVSVQRKTASAPVAPAVPAPCGGRTGPTVSLQRKTASAPVAPAVPAPCGGRTGASASIQRKADMAPPAVPAPCGGRTSSGSRPPVVQRRMTFSAGTGWLDAAAGEFPPLYKAVQDRAKVMAAEVVVVEDAKQASRASYSFDAKSGTGRIAVQPRPGGADAETVNGIVIAMTHETQHAIDDLAPSSILYHQVHKYVAEASDLDDKAKRTQAALGARIMSELHAHGVQAALAGTMRAHGASIPRADDLLSQSYTAADFNEGGHMFVKLFTYFKLYGFTDAQLEDPAPDPEKSAAENAKALQNVVRRRQEAITKALEKTREFIFLNWGEIQELIAKVGSQASAATIGLAAPGGG